MLSKSIAFLFIVAFHVWALPNPSPDDGLSINLVRRSHRRRSTQDNTAWAKAQGDMLKNKYGAAGPHEKRASGTNLYVIKPHITVAQYLTRALD
jgi:hypothetical protein